MDPQPRCRCRHGRLIVLTVMLCVASAAFVVLVGRPSFSSEPYNLALERVQQDRDAMNLLGGPIQPVVWFPRNHIDVDFTRGEADLAFEVAGPKDRGMVRAKARRINGAWQLTSLVVSSQTRFTALGLISDLQIKSVR